MIVVIGSLNYDYVTYMSKVPQAGETIHGISFEEHLGGKGLNEAIAVSRLSPPSKKQGVVQMWGKVGTDSNGDKMVKELINSGVGVELVEKVEDTSSGSASIFVEVDDGGENRIVVIPGANGLLNPTDSELGKVFKGTETKEFLVLQNEFPDPIHVIEWLSENRPNVVKFYNPSPMKKEFAKNLKALNKIEYLVVNQGEALELYEGFGGGDTVIEESDIEKLVLELSKYLTYPNIIITLGGDGCMYLPTGKERKVGYLSSVKVDKVVDTTGAGDTFLGGLCSSLYFNESYELSDAVKFGSYAASLTIQNKGAVESIPWYADVLEAIEKS
ncbi:hypothetical protein CANARDRAFT_26821 [[Candida] arabinofermentans NRRL YB-2248]|uniref:Ribokinase n=1 Tax=[Candida] arabinofermentans NRRL YB-2248 TaxID=983967 RepID=A0A1E4T6T5_9ASCO|nr:hypothetical protein CANARDRAFT_26821 [[Candida] arabinofermentans NRRL YB-2248]